MRKELSPGRGLLAEEDPPQRPALIRDQLARIMASSEVGALVFMPEPQPMGNRFSIISHSRTVRKSGALIASTTIVHRPDAVLPTSSASRHSK